MALRLDSDSVLRLTNLSVDFGRGEERVRAVDRVNLSIQPGELVGLVGESGSGKSSLAYATMGLLPSEGRVSEGEVWLKPAGTLTGLSDQDMSRIRGRHLAMVFQAAQSSFNPIRTIGSQLRLLLGAHRVPVTEGMERTKRLLAEAQLEPERVMKAYPHQLSGGMRQRVGIVFSLVLEPEVILLDEPTTALDVLSQRVVLDVIQQLRKRVGTAMLFISHDFSVVASLSDRIGVMYAGQLVELSPTRDLYQRPLHPYTALLIQAVPRLREAYGVLKGIPGQPPHLKELPPGCRFAPRCPYANARCHQDAPPFRAIADDRLVACWRSEELEGEWAHA